MTDGEIATDTTKPMPKTPAPSSATSIQPMSEIVAPADIDKLATAFKKFEEFKQRLLNKEDAVDIRGRKFLKKSAWRKWALACGVSDDLVRVRRLPVHGKDTDGNFSYRIIVRAFHVPSGRSSVGVAIASLSEKKDWAHPEHDVFTLSHTRAKNRAIADLVGGGEVSAEEMNSESEAELTSTANIGPGSDKVVQTQSAPKRSDEGARPNITEYQLLHGGKNVGAATVDRESDQIFFMSDKPVRGDSGPIANFLVPKVLEATKKKHPEFGYTLRVRGGILEALVVEPIPEVKTIDDLLGAVAWAFSKAGESTA